jgi:hypothetical protein
MKKLVLAVTVLALSILSFGQILPTTKVNQEQEAAAALAQENAAQTEPHSPLATMTCSFTFTSGANNTYLKYCVTINGNITQLQTPLGHEHIAVGTFGEGYGVCDTTTGVAYDDYAGFGDSGNWGAPVTTQPNATTVKVVRSTSDGIWTLTQTITQVAATSSVKIAMALKNNTAIARTAFLMRYADVDADGIFKNNLDGTHNSAFGWNSLTFTSGHTFGLALQTVGTVPFAYDGFAQNVPNGPPPCNYIANFASGTLLTGTDGSIVSVYVVPVPAAGTKSVTVAYKGL